MLSLQLASFNIPGWLPQLHTVSNANTTFNIHYSAKVMFIKEEESSLSLYAKDWAFATMSLLCVPCTLCYFTQPVLIIFSQKIRAEHWLISLPDEDINLIPQEILVQYLSTQSEIPEPV